MDSLIGALINSNRTIFNGRSARLKGYITCYCSTGWHRTLIVVPVNISNGTRVSRTVRSRKRTGIGFTITCYGHGLIALLNHGNSSLFNSRSSRLKGNVTSHRTVRRKCTCVVISVNVGKSTGIRRSDFRFKSRSITLSIRRNRHSLITLLFNSNGCLSMLEY